MKIEKATGTGFCFGVRRAIDILEKLAGERGGVETLGEVVHNRVVLDRLAKKGVNIVRCADDIKGDTVVLGAHGVSPEVEEDLRARHINVIDTTCPFVHRAQMAARRLAEAGFLVIVYGDADHSEVKGILGWAKGKGVAALDKKHIAGLDLPRRIGVISQTTRIPANFTEFVKKLIDTVFGQDSEFRIIDTICHDIRERQTAALELAKRVDLMLVIGGRNSANTNQLAKLCATATETHLVQTADEIDPAWLQGRERIGVTSGTSTDETTIDEVMARLEALAESCC